MCASLMCCCCGCQPQVLWLCAVLAPNFDVTFSLSIVWTSVQLLCSSFFLNFGQVGAKQMFLLLSDDLVCPCPLGSHKCFSAAPTHTHPSYLHYLSAHQLNNIPCLHTNKHRCGCSG